MITDRAYPSWRSWLLWAVVALLYYWRPMHLDYYPDEGYFAELTARMMRGELPNVDFANNYLGGLYVYNIIWFTLLGKSLIAMRMGMLALLAGIFVPVTYQLSRLLTNRFWASITTLVMMTMTVSLNATISGNWYALTFILLALWVFFNICEYSKRWLWLVVGGLIGLAFLMKHTVAIYGAFALFIALLLQLTREEKADSGNNGFWHCLGVFIAVAGLVKAIVLPIYILLPHWSFHGVLMYIVPVSIVAGFLIRRIWRIRNRYPFAKLARTWLLWITGFFIPVFLFFLPYILHGGNALSRLVKEVFIQFPELYLNTAFIDFVPQLSLYDTVVILWVCMLGILLYRRVYVPWAAVLLMGVWGISTFVWASPAQSIVTHTLLTYMQIPLFVMLVGGWYYLRGMRRERMPDTRFVFSVFWILLIMLYFNTYPLGAVFYSIYALVPTVFLLGYVGYRLSPSIEVNWQMRAFTMALAAYAVAYGTLFIYRQVDMVSEDGPLFPNRVLNYELPLPRGGVFVQPEFGLKFTKAVEFIKEHSKRADDVMVLSDLPVLYFLSDHENPTPYSYAMDSYHSDGSDIVAAMEQHNVTWVLADPKQKYFSQEKVIRYLQDNYLPYKALEGGINVFIKRAD